MSKHSYNDGGIDDLPPPYTPSASTPTGATSSSDFLTAHLQGLRTRADIAGDIEDSRLLSRITDAVEALLTSVLGKSQRHQYQPLRVIEAVAVPADVIGPSWVLSDDGADGGESGRIVRIVRVSTRDKGWEGVDADEKDACSKDDGDSSTRTSWIKGFDDWGRWNDDSEGDVAAGSALASWWNDERLARHLVRYLQPIQQAPRPSNARASSAATRIGEVASMMLRAEEATFRRENEMGLWESKTGWAIVFRFRL